MSFQQDNNRSTLCTTRTNKISSTVSVLNPKRISQQQSESMTNRQSHRKYKLSHSQLTKIDKLSKEGLLRWKEMRQSQDESNNKNDHSTHNKRITQKSMTVNKNKEEQKSKTTFYQNSLNSNNQNNKFHHPTSISDKNQQNASSIFLENQERLGIKSKTNAKKQKTLDEMRQSIAQLHSINYKLKKERIINLTKWITLHVEIIQFNMAEQQKKSRKNILPNQKKVSFHNFQEQQNSTIMQNPTKYESQKSQNQDRNLDIIEVICFQVHDQRINMHYRSQFTYKTLAKDVKFVFEDIQELFNYVTMSTNQIIKFNKKLMEIQILIKFTKQSLNYELKLQPKKHIQKIIRIPLLPFAMIEIVQSHNQNKDQKQNKELLYQIKELKNDLEISRNLIHALRQQNQKLKLKLIQQKSQNQKEKAEKQFILQSYEKLSKVSQTSYKQYYFQFVPDTRSKNYTNFIFKSNVLKKVKNDLKWDQVSSQAPLPRAGRHYFSFLIKDFMPDFMFGIVSTKGKDTSNAFLGLETICLYASKNNCYIYERGKHYKLSVNVKRNDTIFVIVDRQKNVIEWIKRKGFGNNSSEKEKVSYGKDQYCKEQDRAVEDPNLISFTSGPKITQDDLQNNNTHEHIRHRKASQTISSSELLSNQLSAISILPLTTAADYVTQEMDYIHSTIIAQELSTKQIYAYLQVYNINEPIKLNERK